MIYADIVPSYKQTKNNSTIVHRQFVAKENNVLNPAYIDYNHILKRLKD